MDELKKAFLDLPLTLQLIIVSTVVACIAVLGSIVFIWLKVMYSLLQLP